jgi:hypothetical protein
MVGYLWSGLSSYDALSHAFFKSFNEFLVSLALTTTNGAFWPNTLADPK